jgi:hypothetical protein
MALCIFADPVTCLQIVIMVTPVAGFFKVRAQNWEEWLFAIALGVGSLALAFFVKIFSR